MPKTLSEEERADRLARIQLAIDSIILSEKAALPYDEPEAPVITLVHSLAKRRPGRPLAQSPKVPVSIRLSPDVLAYFRSGGPGWQGRIDETLREEASLKKQN
ncbi:BrnA antitoxin family protein [Phyllobacterium sp. LjRoot231]|uniref:BrnA antitoxin family protein n=1 Tax=Phyllobacterium sp. LjRoot231 TaxID=3342289 RepID=UPI003ED0FB57